MKTITLLFLASAVNSMASGVSGGGGNVLYPVDPKQPATVGKVKHSIVLGKAALIKYFISKQNDFSNGQQSADDAEAFGTLFSTGFDVARLTESTSIDIESHESCQDVSGGPVDASVIAERSGEVCMSAFAISKKVESDDLLPQSSALFAHEVTELTGLDETDALKVQSKVLEDFRRNSSQK